MISPLDQVTSDLNEVDASVLCTSQRDVSDVSAYLGLTVYRQGVQCNVTLHFY